MKTYYGMELLENAKPSLVHNQFATTPAAATVGATLSSRGAESLHKAMTNYLKSGNTAAATALFQRYEGRITPSQRTRFVKLLKEYQLAV